MHIHIHLLGKQLPFRLVIEPFCGCVLNDRLNALLDAEFYRQVYFVHPSSVEAAHMRKRNRRPPFRKMVLKLPDLDHAKSAVLNSLSSPHSRRN